MQPTTNIVYNYEYAKRLYRGDRDFEDVWRGVIGMGADFEKLYEEYIDYILDLIEKYSGFAWEEYAETAIPIYMIDGEESFCHPVSLVASEDPKDMLEDFIYQMAHRNMYFGFADEKIKQRCLELVTQHVLQDLRMAEPKQYEWDLREKSIKKYLKK
ncbi:MAG: hypothetical protein WCT27_02620 [Patescibacteria group bacterium]